MALSDGLVGYWSPWLGVYPYRAIDRSQFFNHGTMTNMGAYTSTISAAINGKFGKAHEFTVASGSKITTRIVPDITKNITMSAWVYPKLLNTFQAVMSCYTGNSQAFEIFIDNSGSRFTGPNFPFTVTGSATLNAWQFVMISKDAANTRMFVNGVLTATATSPTLTATTNAVCLGKRPDDSFGITGTIAEACLWQRNITQPEALELYRLGPGWYRPYSKRGYGYAVAGFRAYWHRRQQQVIGGGLR